MPRVLRAAATGATLSGLPSTVHALATGRDVLAAAKAAGTLVVADDAPAIVRLGAAVVVHTAISLGWAVVLARVLPGRRPVAEGVVAGLAIAALDLGVIGRRIGPIRDLPQGPQVLDHVAFGVAVSRSLRR